MILQELANEHVHNTGKAVVDQFVATNQKAYPQYFQEMQGMADGANVDYMKVIRPHLKTSTPHELIILTLSHTIHISLHSNAHTRTHSLVFTPHMPFSAAGVAQL